MVTIEPHDDLTVVESDRKVPIPGTSNLRDIGGYVTSSGAEVARHRLYRSEAIVAPGGPASYSFFDVQQETHYQRLGLRAIIDLRSEKEISAAPTAWVMATGAQLYEVPINEGGEGADTNYIRMLLTGELESFDADALGRFYIDLLRHRAESWGNAFRVLAGGDNLPALVHCAAGKDRTGVFIALVLSSLGVPGDVVAEDYALTGKLRPNRIDAYAERFIAAGRDPEIARALFESPDEAMGAMLDYLTAHYGGATEYLLRQAGVTRSELEAVNRNLLLR